MSYYHTDGHGAPPGDVPYTMDFWIDQTSPPMVREVFATMITYFLGNTAILQRTDYNIDGTIKGFMYHAWRSLTPAMIEDIQAESARWAGKRKQGIPPPAQEDYSVSMAARSKTKPLTPTSSLPPATAEPDYALIAYDPAGNPYYHIGERRYLTDVEIEEIKAKRAPRSMPETNEPEIEHPPVSLPVSLPTTVPEVDPGYWTFDPVSQKQCFVRGGRIIQYAP
ncbi:hypothetical protein BJ508DRAFT_325995 [Ascobolus immersus RN42]|uniref:Uncharacterized protein n=1 Tax=Ascobolus immersus RN42 TaxID=1160509 RepID=A0A3N4I7C5_ASCIM|nr:hypothetical protein BJ508DRAFT_325995 [Ascobolus immersus RN42]